MHRFYIFIFLVLICLGVNHEYRKKGLTSDYCVMSEVEDGNWTPDRRDSAQFIVHLDTTRRVLGAGELKVQRNGKLYLNYELDLIEKPASIERRLLLRRTGALDTMTVEKLSILGTNRFNNRPARIFFTKRQCKGEVLGYRLHIVEEPYVSYDFTELK